MNVFGDEVNIAKLMASKRKMPDASKLSDDSDMDDFGFNTPQNISRTDHLI